MTDTFDIEVGGFPGSPGLTGATGGNIMAIGLFVALSTISVPGGTTLVQTSGYDTPGRGHALLIEDTTLDDAAVAAQPRARGKSANGRFFRLSNEQRFNLFQFGATGQGQSNVDDGPALAAMDAYFATANTDPSVGGGYYTGSWTLDADGDFFFNTTTIQPRYSVNLVGSGPGHFWGGGASARWRWADGAHGIIPQTPGTTDLDGVSGTTLKGAPLFQARGIRFEGGYNGTLANEGLWHGIAPRCPYLIENCHFYGWSGIGFRSWAGSLTPAGNIGGNVSEGVLIRCKFENNYIGRSNRGGDANVVRAFGCTYYQNRLIGFEDDDGAGSCVETAPHFASNGMITNPNYWTQTSTGGYRYGLRVGGNKANAPSGGPTHTADWVFIEAGGPIANFIPTYNSALDFRVGGDAMTYNNAGIQFVQLYSEYGTLSQFVSDGTIIIGGTQGSQYFYGGWRLDSSGPDGFGLRSNKNNTQFTLDNDGVGTDSGFVFRRKGVAAGLLTYSYGNYVLNRSSGTGGFVYQLPSAAEVGRNDVDGYKVPNGAGYWVNGLRVLQARRTGWTADTGTAKRTANATYGAGTTLTYSATYVQAEQTAMATRMAAVEAALQSISQTQKAVKDDLITHGAFGA